MAVSIVPSIPNNPVLQTANQQNLLSWDYLAGATSYSIAISTDNFVTQTTATTTTNSYLDTAVTIGVEYFYKVAGVNIIGTGPYTAQQCVIPAPTGEMALQTLRLASQQKADRVNSNFVTKPEWNTFINLAMNELYDLLITTYEDYFMAPRIRFIAPGGQSIFPLPNGSNTFLDTNGATFTPAPFYKLLGVDLSLQAPDNAFVTVNKYNLIARNSFIFPNTASSLYGVFNLQYRLLGTNIEFIPTPSGGQLLQILYIPRLSMLLRETDLTTIGFSGWLEYVIVRAAKYALDKEESDTSKLDQDLMFIKGRIEETAVNRDAGQPERISDIRGTRYDSSGYGPNGAMGGW